MKITSVETMYVRLPLAFHYRAGHAFAHDLPGRTYTGSLIVQIRTDEGITGLGDIIVKGGSAALGQSAKLYLDNALVPYLIGKNPFDIEAIMDQVWEANWHQSAPYAAGLDIALHDLMGKALGVPVFKLLGGRFRARVPLTWNVPADKDINVMVGQAAAAVEDGFTHVIKVKTGTSWDVPALIAIQKAIGPKVPLRPDDNGTFLAAESIQRYKQARDGGAVYELLEQPAPNADLPGLRRVGNALGERVMYHVGYVEKVVAHAILNTNAADVVSVPVFRHGLRQAAQLVQAFEIASIGCAMGSGVEGSIAATAAIHLATALRNMRYPVDTLGPLWFADDILKERPEFGAGYAVAPDAPGLGVELDMKRVEKLRLA
jgi:L-alanine-DL-glutamate epimerase-like enolase superfamily enzyme